ncbi:TPA: beta-galactosidase, partial [Candidatus Sumerlaeota bacterium]|nr:beta-galactosidase [Candidatus Sumerlaeota bacterium]
DAPISEAGWVGEKYQKTRDLVQKYLDPSEKLPALPAMIPTTSIPSFKLTETAPVFDNLPTPVAGNEPLNMEAYNQGHGCTLYRTQLPSGPAAKLKVAQAHDFAWVFVDGKQAGVMDRRSHLFSVSLPAREKAAQLDILVEAMGHVNFGKEIHDRKGLMGPVELVAEKNTTKLEGNWQAFPLPLDDKQLASLKWKAAEPIKGPAFYRGTFAMENPADTFLDLSNWGKGVIWVNGHCLARIWNIGPTQTAYLPGAWMKKGGNEVIILDLLGPTAPTIAGLEKPILDKLRPELDFASDATPKTTLVLDGVKPVYKGTFAPGSDVQVVKLPQPVKGKQFC